MTELLPPTAGEPNSQLDRGWLNPVYTAELRHVLSLRRTPLLLAGLTIIVTLLVCSLGALGSLNQEPTRVGAFVYQVFFSLAFGLVTWIGPGVAAAMMASERATSNALTAEGRQGRLFVRGKFAAALTYILSCLLTISPIATIVLVFGGVTPAEIAIAFALVGVAATVAVGFGLSIGSLTSSVALALLLSVPVGAIVSILAYLVGIASSSLAVAQWGVIAEGTPFWLPTVFSRADADNAYYFCLLLVPLALLGIALWFLYEITVSNLLGATQDRATRLRYWFSISTLLLYTGAALASAALGQTDWIGDWIILALIASMSLFGLCVFAGDALLPSPEVKFDWERVQASRFRRFFGPGVVKAVVSVSVLALVGVLLLVGAVLFRTHDFEADTKQELLALVASGSYLVGFVAFLAGFIAFVRSRSRSGVAPRLLLGLSCITITIGPLLIAGITALVSGLSDDMLPVIGALSPAYLGFMIVALETGSASTSLLITTAFAAAGAWLVVGLVLLWRAQRAITQQLPDDKSRPSEGAS